MLRLVIILILLINNADARYAPPKQIVSQRAINTFKVHKVVTIIKGTKHTSSTQKND
jgi:hypothetical protein